MRGTWQDTADAALEALPLDLGEFVICHHSDSSFALAPVDPDGSTWYGQIDWSENRDQYRAIVFSMGPLHRGRKKVPGNRSCTCDDMNNYPHYSDSAICTTCQIATHAGSRPRQAT